MRNLIIGTSGHVDHGKTEIVKALTGRNTDRLKEEQERGISIVLGFAPLDLGGGVTAGIVDVPGHERFVKTMVSGAVGVDLALLVVAADEGVMPQTEEHFEVLRLLGVKGAVIAITKIDLADDGIIGLVEEEIRNLVKGSVFEGAPVIRTSAVTGAGLSRLRETLRDRALALDERESSDFFRMPIDRVWTRSGIGTIVTGTAWSGEVRKGAELVLEPGGTGVRVREVQSFEETLEKASAGMRTALALHGVRVSEVEPGMQALTPGVLAPASMLNAFIEVGRLSSGAIKNRQRVRFHHAASEIIGRVVTLDGGEIAPGAGGFVQLRLERPAVARRGDRFILRSYSPQRVIGGGRILDPDAPKLKAHSAELVRERLKALDAGTAEDAIIACAASGGNAGFGIAALARYGLARGEIAGAVDSLVKAGRLVSIEGRVFERGVVSETGRSLVAMLEAISAENKLSWGVDREELKERSALRESPLFDYLMEEGKRGGMLFFKGGRVRSGSGERKLSAADEKALGAIEARVREAGHAFATKADLLAIVRDEKRLVSYLHILADRGTIVRISADGAMDAERYRELLEKVRSRLLDDGTLSVGDFKDMFGFSRKFAVPILEHLDREGFTRREGDARKAGPKFI
ncbi:MAG: selenocysteine-specific translation elongation factor [Candidatus Krumholzibacteria bacterium]|nr:selenocysteine-specific translation elongation factor [Candidatus Krumholzibacteria bacterium]